MTDLPSDTEPTGPEKWELSDQPMTKAELDGINNILARRPGEPTSTAGTGAWRERRRWPGTIADRHVAGIGWRVTDRELGIDPARSEAELLAAILEAVQAIRAHLARTDPGA